MYQLHVTLLPLILTLFFPLSVEVTGATIPTQARTKEALETVGKFLKDDIGSNWLANVSKDRVKPFTTEEFMKKIINSTRSDAVREAAGIIALVLEQQRNRGKTNESLITEPEGLKEFIEAIADRNDVICIYRKISRFSMDGSEEWEKIMTDVTTDYSIYLALDTGHQYVLCVKKIESNSTSTIEVIESITEITGGTEGIVINSTSEITPETLETDAKRLLEHSPITLNGDGTMKVSRAVDGNNAVDNENEGIRERGSSEDCGSESISCTSALISSAMFDSNSNSPEADSESVESTSADEEESAEDERRLMRGIIGDNDESVGRVINRVIPCKHRIEIFTRQSPFYRPQDHNSRNGNIRNDINGRYSMQKIPNSRELPMSSGSQLHISSNYELFICQFNKICHQIKSPESQQGLMNIPMDLQLNNESPEGLLNVQPRFSHNADGFVKNLHDNEILTHQPYSTHVDTRFVVLKGKNNDGFPDPFASGYYPNFIPTQHSVEPSSKLVTRQLLRGGYSRISRNPQDIHVRQSPSYSDTNTEQIDALKHQEDDGLLSLKIFVNIPSKKVVELSIYTELGPEIGVHHNKDHYLDNGLTQSQFKMSKQPEESLEEQQVDKLITEVNEIEKLGSKDEFHKLMDLVTSNRHREVEGA